MTTANSLPGADDITRAVLPNGVTILTRSNFNRVLKGLVTAFEDEIAG